MPDISKVKSGDLAVFNVEQKRVEVEVVGVDPLMPDIYSLDLQGEDGILNVIVNNNGKDILGESPLRDVIKVIKKSKNIKQVNYELAEFDKERENATKTI